MSSRLPVFFIVMTVVIDAMGIGLIVPVMPALLREVQGADLGQAAVWGGILATSFAVMQFLFSPLMGRFPTASGAAPSCLLVFWSCLRITLSWLLQGRSGFCWLAV